MNGGPPAGRRLVLAAGSFGLSLLALGANVGGAVVLVAVPADTYSASERAVFIAIGLAVGALLIDVAALVVAIVGLRRRPASAPGTALAVTGLVLSILGMLGAAALGVFAFLVALIAHGAVST